MKERGFQESYLIVIEHTKRSGWGGEGEGGGGELAGVGNRKLTYAEHRRDTSFQSGNIYWDISWSLRLALDSIRFFLLWRRCCSLQMGLESVFINGLMDGWNN